MKKLITILAIVVFGIGTIQAQLAGDLDTTFNPTDPGKLKGFGFNALIASMHNFPNGSALVGGNFTSFQGVSAVRIAKVKADGSRDTTFDAGAGANSWVMTMDVQSNGKIVIGGLFTNFDNKGHTRIARLNTDGSIDTSFHTGSGFNNRVTKIKVQADGKIVVAGWFTQYNGVTADRITRLNADGTLDVSYNAKTLGTNNNIYGMDMQADGKILVGGFFTKIGSTSLNRFARLNTDGSVDTSFHMPAGEFNWVVQSVLAQQDGNILVLGAFSTYGSTAAKSLVRLSSTGALDTAFNSNVSTGFNQAVHDIIQLSDKSYIAGGFFTAYNGTTVQKVCRINSNGSIDPNYKPYVSGQQVYAIGIQATTGKVMLAGEFGFIDDYRRGAFSRMNSDGSVDFSYNTLTGLSNAANDLMWLPNGKILVGGSFTSYNGRKALQMVMIDSATGKMDTSFKSLGLINSNNVNKFGLQSDGKILVAGWMGRYGDSTIYNFMRLDSLGNKEAGFPVGTGFNSTVQNFVIQPDGKIICIGNFTVYNGVSEKYIIRLNADGTKDASFNTGTGFNNSTYEIRLQSDGKILVAGQFTSYNGTTANRIIRLNSNGSIDNSFLTNMGTGFNNYILGEMLLQPDGKILVAGHFSSFNGSSAIRIARLNSDGTRDTSFHTGNGFNNVVVDLILMPNGKIIAWGNFTSYSGKQIRYLARLNPDGTLDSSFDPGISFNVGNGASPLLAYPDGRLLVAGSATSYQGVGRNYLFRIFGETVCNLSASASAEQSASCFGSMDGKIKVTTSGAHGNTNYFWNNPQSSSTDSLIGLTDTTNTISGLIQSTYVITITDSQGCTDTASATVLEPTEIKNTISDTACDSYTSPSGNHTWTTSGTYADTLVGSSATGCDSILTINLTINKSSTYTLADTACNSYTSPSGKTWTSSGNYTDTIPNAANCDSVITINLTVNKSTTSAISPTACDSYTSPSGKIWTSSGTYTDTIPNAANCDSTITINLTVNKGTAGTISPTACDSYTSPSGKTWTTSGTYTDTIPNAVNCDSTITINLTVNKSTTGTISPTVCDSYTSPSGKTWTTSGTYTDTIPNAVNCDSTITINLTVNKSTTGTISPTACDSYTSPSGKTWTTSGTYMDTLANAALCDSVITINLTVNKSSQATIFPVVCEYYLSPSGSFMTSFSGTYFDTIPNAAGCDSALTIHLTVNFNSHDTLNPVSCDEYTSPSLLHTWTTSGTYQDTLFNGNALGCDSVLTIHLTILHTGYDTISPVACDSYVSPSGKTFTTSGNYTDTIPTVGNCDSIITINLTVSRSTSATLKDTACFEYTSPSGNYVWDANGNYQDTIPNAVGCDSVLTIELVINTVDTAVTQDVHSLIAQASNINSTYQWLNCNDNFSGLNDTMQTFTPGVNGNYAVEVTTNGCVDTSSCYAITNVGWKESASDWNWSAYPNPTSGRITLDFGQRTENLTLLIRDASGRLVHQEQFESIERTEVEISGESGMYLIEVIATDGKRAMMRVMKQE